MPHATAHGFFAVRDSGRLGAKLIGMLTSLDRRMGRIKTEGVGFEADKYALAGQ
jgi:hypothetical protein